MTELRASCWLLCGGLVRGSGGPARLGTVLEVRSAEAPDGWGDLVLIKALPWDGGGAVLNGGEGAGGGGPGPLYDGCSWEVDRAQPQWAEPLNGPPMQRVRGP